VSLEKAIEGQIQDAMAAGVFKNLPGEGKPLAMSSQDEALAGDNWLGYKMLQNSGHLPEWLNLAREIELDLEKLAKIDQSHAEYCATACASGDWQAYRGSVDRVRERYEKLAREIRTKQDRFNHDAPGIRSQRPGIWVEHHLERMRERERASGG